MHLSCTGLGSSVNRTSPARQLAVVAVFCADYVSRAKAAKTFGGRALWACAVILALHLFNSPVFSPAK